MFISNLYFSVFELSIHILCLFLLWIVGLFLINIHLYILRTLSLGLSYAVANVSSKLSFVFKCYLWYLFLTEMFNFYIAKFTNLFFIMSRHQVMDHSWGWLPRSCIIVREFVKLSQDAEKFAPILVKSLFWGTNKQSWQLSCNLFLSPLSIFLKFFKTVLITYRCCLWNPCCEYLGLPFPPHWEIAT